MGRHQYTQAHTLRREADPDTGSGNDVETTATSTYLLSKCQPAPNLKRTTYQLACCRGQHRTCTNRSNACVRFGGQVFALI